MRLTEEPFYASAVIFQEAGGVCLSGRRRIVENHPQRLISGGGRGETDLFLALLISVRRL